MSNRNRLNLRTSDEIIARIEALAHLSGESKNSVANVLLAVQLGGTTSGTTSEKSETSKNHEESEATTMVEHNSSDNSEKESGATSKPKSKRVPSPPTPPSPSQKEKPPKGVKKKKVSSQGIGENRKPKDFAECLEYFKQRRIPNPQRKAEQFFAHYEANGWKQGRTPLAKWGYALNKWIGNNPDWRPEKDDEAKGGESLEAVLKWMEKKHPEWYEKHKDAKTINEIDGYYIDEYRN